MKYGNFLIPKVSTYKRDFNQPSKMTDLNNLLQPINLSLDETQLQAFQLFKELLIQANARTNLTRIAPEDIELLHFADSLYASQAMPDNKDQLLVVDIGTGAGFPGIPLAIAYPEMQILLVDTAKRKVDFLEYALLKLGLKNCTTKHARAEDLPESTEFRDRFDIALARAVSSSEELMQLSFPLLRQGGSLIALKGPAEEENEGSISYQLPGTEIKRMLQIFKK